LKYFITGGCGFIGLQLIKNLINKPDTYIKVFDNLSVGTKKDLVEICRFEGQNLNEEFNARLQLIPGDINDEATLIRHMAGSDIVIHLAANTGVAQSVIDPFIDLKTNVIGTFNVLSSAKKTGAKKVIFASSGAPLGEQTPPLHENMAPRPQSPYGASKLAGEGYCSAFYNTFGLATVCLRFSNVYGPGSKRKNSVVAKFIKKIINGEPITIYGDGNQTRDFIYVDDLIEAIISCVFSKNVDGEVLQIATNIETSVSEISNMLTSLAEKKHLKLPIIALSEPRLGDVKRNFSDTSKISSLTGWAAKTNLIEGLEKTFDYFFNIEKES
jgi:UDP-glucose 4-epimerase